MEYTNDFLCRMFAAYAPCDIADVANNQQFKMVGVSFHEGNFQVDRGGYSDWWNITSSYKPILLPLSEITDEHAIEVAKLLGVEPGRGKTVASFYDGGNGQKNFETTQIRTIIVLDYLRSHGYDCGFQHIPSLIGAGLAISKTN